MKFGDILRNEHFNNIAAIIRVPFRSPHWKQEHPGVPFWKLHDELNAVKTEQWFAQDRREFTKRFLAFLVTLTEADPSLTYMQDDLAWFVQIMDSDEALVTVSLLFAWFSAPDEMLTPAEVAERTGTAESGWRNKAAAGKIPGVVKKGKQWLLPQSVLRAKGVLDKDGSA